jgi:hypothetical protein
VRRASARARELDELQRAKDHAALGADDLDALAALAEPAASAKSLRIAVESRNPTGLSR